ncbi:MAG: phage integrase SAM-like domain-containing protein [Bacteroidales bacterium]|jgi:integrase
MKNRRLTNQLRYCKGNIVYYYYSKGRIIRIPLIKVNDINEIDKKSCLFKVQSLEKFNEKVKDDHDKISSIIYKGIEEGKEITREYINEQLTLVPEEEIPITDLFDKFIVKKEKGLLSKETIKDYKSCKKVFEDFQDYKLIEYKRSMINEDLLLDFRKYLLEERGYNDNSISKRFKTLSSFLNSIDIDYSKIKPKLQSRVSDFVVLDKKDLELLKNFKKFTPKEQFFIDIFLMNCFMGLRFGDLSTLNKGSFIVEGKETYYQKNNEKTKQQIKIYLVPTVKDILKKYDYQIPTKLTNQVFNREIKNVFKTHDLFKEKVKLSEMIGNKSIVTEYLKRELISSHTCRRTFITMNIKNKVDFSSIMKMTGHSQLSTLNRYIKKSLDIKQIKKIDI